LQQDLTVQLVFDTMCTDLGVTWLAGKSGATRVLSRETPAADRPHLIGPLNFGTPNRVQVLGKAECALLEDTCERAGESATRKQLQTLFETSCDLVVVTDNRVPPTVLQSVAENLGVAVFRCESSYNDCVNLLRYRLTQFLAESQVLHGVLMDVLGTGVLITGGSGVGKSELALELISRGHILVADDAPEFRRIAPDTIEGRCPELLQDFLEVRGLGILNIARMYGHAQTRRRKILKFIIRLEIMLPEELNNTFDRDQEPRQNRDIFGVPIPEQIMPVLPGRNLAVLVEAAVRNHILINTGYNAVTAFSLKQREAMQQHPDNGSSTIARKANTLEPGQ